jgi:hypothetical protein
MVRYLVWDHSGCYRNPAKIEYFIIRYALPGMSIEDSHAQRRKPEEAEASLRRDTSRLPAGQSSLLVGVGRVTSGGR